MNSQGFDGNYGWIGISEADAIFPVGKTWDELGFELMDEFVAHDVLYLSCLKKYLNHMIEALALRNDVLSKLKNKLGRYIFPNGASIEAICVLPDPERGWNYPQEGTKISGLECVIKRPYPQPQPNLGGSLTTSYWWEIHLKQWDKNQSLLESNESLLELFIKDYQLKQMTYMPYSDKLLTVEQCKIYLEEYRVIVN